MKKKTTTTQETAGTTTTTASASGRPTVWVLSKDGFKAHGAPRASVGQATSVARTLAKRLGWTTEVSDTCPEPGARTSDLPATLASLSPIWKDATLAAKWNAHKAAAK